jgi:N-methylhydantoinase A
LAGKTIQEHVAKPLGISLEEAASGIIRVVNANMVRGISVSSTERGFDVREFALLPFGGAGPLHAVELAEDLGMSRVVIPMYPSTLSAVGLLVANTRHDYVTTMAKSQADLVPEEILAAFKELEARGRAQLKAQNVPDDLIEIQWSADIRYAGQSYELNTPVTRKETLTQADMDEVIDRFHQLHYRIYAYGSAEETVEFINLRVGAIGKVPEMSFTRRERVGGDPSAAGKGSRLVYYPAHGFIDTAVYERDLLQPGNVIRGPCLVEEIASTSVLTPGAKGVVDEYGNIIVELGG